MPGLDFLNRIVRLDLRRHGAAICEVEVEGSSIWYADLPSRKPGAPTMVLIHGLGGSATSFYPVIPRLRSGYRVVLPDLPGHGFSRPPRGETHLPFHRIVETCDRLLARVAPEGAFVAGNSLGGWITMRLALRRPDLVKGAAFLNAAGPALQAEDWADLSRVLYAEERNAMDEWFGRIFHRPPWVTRFFAEDFRSIFRGHAVRKLMENLRAEDFVDEDEVKRIACPTMLVWGKNDRLLSSKARDWYATHVPGIRVAELDECGHCPQLEKPRHTAGLLLELKDMMRPA